MDRLAHLTTEQKRLSINIDTDDSVDEYDEDMDGECEGWSDDEAAPTSNGEPRTPGSGKRRLKPSRSSVSASSSPFACFTPSGTVIARSEDEAVHLLLTSTGQTTIELDPSIDKEAVRVRVDAERERMRVEREKAEKEVVALGSTHIDASALTTDPPSAADAAAAAAAGGVDYHETDLFKKLQAMRSSAEHAAASANHSTADADDNNNNHKTDTSSAATGGPMSTLPALKILTQPSEPSLSSLKARDPADEIVSPRSKKQERKEQKEREKREKVKSPREKKGVLASLLGK
jgi:hypothetical protein